jgi:ERI1 exoribonuclease 3
MNLSDLKYLIILDFEANCSENNSVPLEIIEFPCVVYDIENDIIKRDIDFSYFCKINTKLTPFCTQLTSITQKMSDSGESLSELLKLHSKWMFTNDLKDKSMFVTCGDWDLKTALPTHCKLLGIKYPNYLKKWCNVKIMFEETYYKKSRSMTNMLDELNLKLDGVHHRGIDDCANTAKICQKLINDGCKFRITFNTVC